MTDRLENDLDPKTTNYKHHPADPSSLILDIISAYTNTGFIYLFISESIRSRIAFSELTAHEYHYYILTSKQTVL